MEYSGVISLWENWPGTESEVLRIRILTVDELQVSLIADTPRREIAIADMSFLMMSRGTT